MAGFARSNAPSGGGYNPYASGNASGGYQPPARSSNRVPPPSGGAGFASSGGYPQEKASYGGGNASSSGHLVVNCPPDLIMTNCVVLNPQEWGNTQYVIIDRQFVFTAMWVSLSDWFWTGLHYSICLLASQLQRSIRTREREERGGLSVPLMIPVWFHVYTSNLSSISSSLTLILSYSSTHSVLIPLGRFSQRR